MSSQITEMSQPDSPASGPLTVEEERKTEGPGGVGSQTETKADLRVVITINPTETAPATAASQADNNTTESGKDQTDSLTTTSTASTDSVDSGDSGVVNQAFVEDETEQSSGKVSRKKGHNRSPSYSPNKDDEVVQSSFFAQFFFVLFNLKIGKH